MCIRDSKSVQPSESWVSATKNSVMSQAPITDSFNADLSEAVNQKASFNFNFSSLNLNKLLVPVSMLVFVLFGGFFTVSASKTSLPGDALYSVKMVSASVELAVASKDVRAEVQIRQALSLIHISEPTRPY